MAHSFSSPQRERKDRLLKIIYALSSAVFLFPVPYSLSFYRPTSPSLYMYLIADL